MNRLPTSSYLDFAEKGVSLYEKDVIGEDLIKLILTFSFNHRVPVLISEFNDAKVKNVLSAAKSHPKATKQFKENIDNILSGNAYRELKAFRSQSGD